MRITKLYACPARLTFGGSGEVWGEVCYEMIYWFLRRMSDDNFIVSGSIYQGDYCFSDAGI